MFLTEKLPVLTEMHRGLLMMLKKLSNVNIMCIIGILHEDENLKIGKGISVIIMTDLICGRIWVNFTYISWGVALRCLPPKMSPFILRCFRDLFVSFYSQVLWRFS